MANDNDDPVERVKKDAFVMPVLPKSLKVDPVVAAFLHLAAFMELSGDDTVDLDWSVEAMEHVGYYLQQLSAEQVATLQEQIERVAQHARQKKWSQEAQEFLAEFLGNFEIGEEE